MSIEKLLNIEFPIYWNDSAIEKKYAEYLIYTLIRTRPSTIVELGSGISTMIIAKTLIKLGYDFKLISFDADETFIQETSNLLISENIYDEKRIKLILAPIEKVNLNGRDYKWYKWDQLEFDIDNIDLLFIDGPQGSICKNSRYPALPVFRQYLKSGSLILLHDSKRNDELEIVETWKIENKDIKAIYNIETERGGIEIHF